MLQFFFFCGHCCTRDVLGERVNVTFSSVSGGHLEVIHRSNRDSWNSPRGHGLRSGSGHAFRLSRAGGEDSVGLYVISLYPIRCRRFEGVGKLWYVPVQNSKRGVELSCCFYHPPTHPCLFCSRHPLFPVGKRPSQPHTEGSIRLTASLPPTLLSLRDRSRVQNLDNQWLHPRVHQG